MWLGTGTGLDYPAYVLLPGGQQRHVLPVPVVAVGVAGDP